MIGFAPQDTTFRCSYYSEIQGVPTDQNAVSGTSVNFPEVSDSTFIPEKFTEARLVGASMKVSYIGTHDQESGFFTGSHIFDSTPFNINEEHIEEGYFPTRCNPSHGIRLVYLPKDEADLEFSPTQLKMEVRDPGTISFTPEDFLPHKDTTDSELGLDGE